MTAVSQRPPAPVGAVQLPRLARSSSLSRAIATAAGLALVIGAFLLAVRRSEFPPEPADWILAVAGLLLGVRVVAYAPRNAVGWLLLAIGGFASVTVLAAAGDSSVLLAWLRDWTWWPRTALLPVLALVFPDGRPATRRWRPVLWGAIGGAALSTVGIALAAGPDPRGFLREAGTPAGDGPGRASWYADIGLTAYGVGTAMVVLAAVLAVPCLALRVARMSGPGRRGVSWALAAAVVLVVAGAVDGWWGLSWGWFVAAAALPGAAVVAIVRHGLYDIDLLVHRGLLYGALTLLLLAGYSTTVAVAGQVAPDHGTAIAAVLAAVAVHPTYVALRRGVDRYLYGEGRDAHATMTRLGERLERHLAPAEVLPMVAATIGSALKVPYVAIRWPEEARPVAEYGTPTDRPLLCLPLTYRGEAIGELGVAARSPDEHFTRRELRALTGLARQAGVAASAIRLTLDLQGARERLILSREEERRRLRRDLHDGVGPSLAGMTMQVGVVRSLIRDGELAPAAELLEQLERGLHECVGELRGVVRGLRPPALDERGLQAAIEEQASRFVSGGRLAVRADCVGAELTDLPAAVEVAALRISVEAVTNAARHARAHTCEVRLHRDGRALLVEIGDDGDGIDARARPGVGIAAMRERAAELGGVCTVERRLHGGTLVRARLPLPDTDSRPPDGRARR
jgi:signal transduction histidine kinase